MVKRLSARTGPHASDVDGGGDRRRCRSGTTSGTTSRPAPRATWTASPGARGGLALRTAGVEGVLHPHADAGVDTALPAAVVDLFRRGMDAGRGPCSFAGVVELAKRRRLAGAGHAGTADQAA
ncbi:hypothetical protein ACFWUZ_22275 [Streptomyces sp. NPDC058646]|uniref:imine reductase family protein n=1 Tax=Streptomyces sp. NPDC058646 TaxID=3346574 RepID=UPI0036672D22